jgi:hypothetical protein
MIVGHSRAREREVERLEEQRRRLGSKLHVLYCRNQVTSLERAGLRKIRAGAPVSVQGAIDLMELTSRTADLFLIQSRLRI